MTVSEWLKRFFSGEKVKKITPKIKELSLCGVNYPVLSYEDREVIVACMDTEMKHLMQLSTQRGDITISLKMDDKTAYRSYGKFDGNRVGKNRAKIALYLTQDWVHF